jgi:hypothetical protein
VGAEQKVSLHQDPTVVQLLQQIAAPECELTKFNGDPLTYRLFITEFQELVETRIFTQRGRLNRLLAYTEEAPRSMIEECVYMADGYTQARKLLEEEYGNLNAVSAAYEKELARWPNIMVRN